MTQKRAGRESQPARFSFLLRSYPARLLSSSSLVTESLQGRRKPAQGLRTLCYIRMGAQELERADPLQERLRRLQSAY